MNATLEAASPPIRIGLFGGTFDPIHDGHVHLANLALEALSLGEVRFIPCRISPHKTARQPASAADRLEMLRLALSKIPWATIDDRELTSSEPSYSYLTAQSIASDFPNARLFWIMGADQWLALPRWKNPETLAATVEFMVLARDGQQPEPREGYRLHVVHGEHPASASAIREAISNGTGHIPWLHPAVADWIHDCKFYKIQFPD